MVDFLTPPPLCARRGKDPPPNGVLKTGARQGPGGRRRHGHAQPRSICTLLRRLALRASLGCTGMAMQREGAGRSHESIIFQYVRAQKCAWRIFGHIFCGGPPLEHGHRGPTNKCSSPALSCVSEQKAGGNPCPDAGRMPSSIHGQDGSDPRIFASVKICC